MELHDGNFLYKLKVRLPRCASFNFSPHIRKMKILGKRLIFFSAINTFYSSNHCSNAYLFED